ncbi:MAG: hypothetical protein K8R46_02265 [Pirellulales bacterium]|nr:hypothetical protein [Pirellulales bacterium]
MVNVPEINEKKVLDAVQSISECLISFDQGTRTRVFRTVQTHFGIDVATSSEPMQVNGGIQPRLIDKRTPHFSNREELPPKDFLFQKQPKTDVERVACLAYYLAHYRDTRHFKTIDISKINMEAAQQKLSNTTYTVTNATNTGLLTSAGRGAKQLSAMGERYVESLPDRNAAREMKTKMRPRRNRKKTATKKSKR